ncbi:hypothetical protein D3C87_1975240 [compost metagenome]
MGRLRPGHRHAVAAHHHEEPLPDGRRAKVAGSQFTVIDGITQSVQQLLRQLAVSGNTEKLAALHQRRMPNGDTTR